MHGMTTEILFEKFEIIEVLKKDEHAAVYLANHIYLSKKIILKVLNTLKLSDQALVERFKREAKLLAKLDHPNIIKVLDFGTSKEFFYISFEYIEGTSLRNVLNSKTLSFDEKKHLMIQLLKALHYAHSFQIIHRDIKPENVFIDSNLNLKLGDFGLALSSEDSFVTNPYSIVGTPSYMSPEQVRGAKLTLQSDLFSTGVLLYELFAGKNPFLKENVTLTLNEIMSYSEDSLEENLKVIQPEIKDVLYRLLRKRPEQRYAGALETLKDLNVSLEEQTLTIKRGEKKAKSDRKKIITAFALLIFIFVFVIALQLTKDANDGKLPSTAETENIAEDKTQNKLKENPPTEDNINGSNFDVPLIENKAPGDKEINSEQNQNQNGVIAYGALTVNCLPFADVYVDGEKIGSTPMQRPMQFLAGSHTLKLVHPDYPPYSEEIIIRDGESTKINVLLDTTMSYVKCDVLPWGHVYVNGDLKGTTPRLGLIKVVPGFVNLTVKNPFYKDIDTSFRAKKNDTIKVKITFKK